MGGRCPIQWSPREPRVLPASAEGAGRDGRQGRAAAAAAAAASGKGQTERGGERDEMV